MKLHPKTKRPAAPNFEVRTFPGVRRSMLKLPNTNTTRDKIVFALGEESGNIWTTKLSLDVQRAG